MRQKGLDAESFASEYLKDKGYRIIQNNFHSRFGEIDIIASYRKTLIFVEVKMRSNSFFGKPLEYITNTKLEKMKKTAFYFMTLNNLNNVNFRFDAIEVNSSDEAVDSINHIENITL